MDFQQPSHKPNTLTSKVYGAIARDLEQCPYDGLTNPTAVRD